jgi:hypothetical protein
MQDAHYSVHQLTDCVKLAGVSAIDGRVKVFSSLAGESTLIISGVLISK